MIAGEAPRARILAAHLGLLAALGALHLVLPEYHDTNLARIMVLASFALGYDILFGYAGLLSLGHAMFLAAGVYGTGLAMRNLGWAAEPAFALGVASGAALALAVGLFALRTTGVAFMIVTLMFAQAGYLVALYFNEWTRGDEGFVLAQASRVFAGFDLTTPDARYVAALGLFGLCLLAKLWLAMSPAGRVLVAIRENEERTRMLGYDPWRYKLAAVVISGVYAGAAGATYALLFGYVGATFATVQYSIFPLLWVLLGGAGTVVGPLIGTAFMFYLVDISSDYTPAYMLLVGAALIGLTSFAPKGLMGFVRARWLRWLP
jgi:branched-chain amino acid transport system permease protein